MLFSSILRSDFLIAFDALGEVSYSVHSLTHTIVIFHQSVSLLIIYGQPLGRSLVLIAVLEVLDA